MHAGRLEPLPRRSVVYPDSDGMPMADNTLQFEWIVTIKENLDVRLPDFVAGDLLWYPVEGDPKLRAAPDVLVALGRPKGYRGSYRQWEEGNVPPTVVFEVLSPGNTFPEMVKKLQFYDRHGAEEFYIFDPDRLTLAGYVRRGAALVPVDQLAGFVSPRLGIRFELRDDGLEIFDREGARFRSYADLAKAHREQLERAQQETARAEAEKDRAEAEKHRAQVEQARAEAAEGLLAREREHVAALLAKLRLAGLEP
ncbi:MAG: Uma2 family endonuclease [Deltaproteobacteria bacterium]|nr:Uma2 family endonuclease [Deltaproteobacteria bacterium]